MKPTLARIGLLLTALALGACQKKTEAPAANAAPAPAPKNTAVELVKENQRSKNFLAVSKHLDLGGTLYAYVDIDGDVLKLTGTLKSLMTAAASSAKADPNVALAARQDYDAIVQMLGLTDVKALGISSAPDGTGYFRNRMFLYTGGERHGLMAGLGGKPAQYKHLGLAPADTAFYGEAELDFAVIYKTLKDVVAKVAGEPAGTQMEAVLRQAGDAAAVSLLDLIYGLKGRSAMVMRIDATRTMRLPGPQALVLPAFQLLVTVDNVGKVLEPSLEKLPFLKRSEVGSQRIYQLAQQLPVEGFAPAFVVDGTQLYFTTSLDFLKECRELKSGLAQTPEFQKSLAEVGAEGNGLTYLSPRFFEQIRRVEQLNPDIPAEAKPVFAYIFANLPKAERPIIASRINLDDGILVKAHMNRSFKQEIAAGALYPVAIVAAMAIPAFQKVRESSQEKAVLNNLRMLAAAADQHYLETGTTTATYDQLVGPSRYIKVINPVDGENYRALRFRQGDPLRVRTKSGKVVEYNP